MSFRITHRLLLGFFTIIVMFGISGAFIYAKKVVLEQLTDRLVELRVPTTVQALSIATRTHETLALTRGYLLTGSEKMKAEWSHSWEEIGTIAVDMDKFSKNWTNPKNQERWTEAGPKLPKLRAAQEKAMALKEMGSGEEALAVLRTDAMPNAKRIVDLMEGEEAVDGTRGEGLVSNQVGLIRIDSAEIIKELGAIGSLIIISTIGAMIVGAGIAFFTARSVAKPLQKVNSAMEVMSQGKLDIDIPGRERGDETGEVARALEGFRKSLVEAERLRDEREIAARKDLEIQARKLGITEGFVSASSEIVQAITAAATELQTSARTLSATADQGLQKATAVSAASEQAAANVQTVAAASEELASSIVEINRQVSESARTANKAVEDAEQSNEKIQSLAVAADKIDAVRQLISDIAEQTNLLALNATIEAARAGEAGKGFAVVASEVKKLAGETAKATSDIAEKISEIQTAARQSVESIGGIRNVIGHINTISSAIAAAVEEQGAATGEISRNVQEAAAGTQDVNVNIAGVREAAGETDSAATQVQAASSELERLAERMSREVSEFVERLNHAA